VCGYWKFAGADPEILGGGDGGGLGAEPPPGSRGRAPGELRVTIFAQMKKRTPKMKKKRLCF